MNFFCDKMYKYREIHYNMGVNRLTDKGYGLHTGVWKTCKFYAAFIYHEQEENHEIMRPRPNKNFLHFSEKSDKDLQDRIFQSNTRTEVNLELLTDDNKKTSKQSTIAQNHEEASIDQEDILDFAAIIIYLLHHALLYITKGN